MKGTGKRVLSVSLAVMMALGMPSGTFADAPDAEAFEQTSEAEVPVAERSSIRHWKKWQI